MNWYWGFVRYHHRVNTDQHRFEADNNEDAVEKAKEWIIEKIGFYNEFVVAKETFTYPEK